MGGEQEVKKGEGEAYRELAKVFCYDITPKKNDTNVEVALIYICIYISA